MRAQIFQKRVGLRQILAVRALAFIQIRHGVEPKPVDAHIEPEIDDVEHCLPDCGIVEVEIGLVRIEPMPVVGLRDGIPGPVRSFKILEDDARVVVFVRRVAPDVEITPLAARRGAARALKPGMLIGSVIDHQFGDHAKPAAMRFAQEDLEVLRACRRPGWTSV